MHKFEACLAITLVALLSATALAGDCCEHCGCQSCVHKVCHLKCELKKVPKTCYSCECEDFCVPGPSKRCGYKSETDCDGCKICKPNYVPTWAEVHTRKKLVKRVVWKEELTYTWCVEYLCNDCAKCAAAEQRPQPSTAEVAGATQSASAESPAQGQPVAADASLEAPAPPVSYSSYRKP